MQKYFLGIIALCTFICTNDALYNDKDVVELTSSNFDKLVLKDDSIWIVEFYAPWCGHCQSLVPEYQKAAQALKNFVKVGAVDADKHSSLGQQYGVKGFPTIKIFGQNKGKPTDFQGQRTAQGIADAGIDEVKRKVKSVLGGAGSDSGSSGDSSNVIELTDSNFDKLVLESDDVWLIEFYAPWCGHCKSLAPHWDKAATDLKGKVKLGALDATIHRVKASQYDVKGFPTIKFFPSGKKDVGDATDYSGGRTASDIVTFAMDKYSDAVVAPELFELVDDKILDKACEGKPLCVVSILPHILDCDAKCRNRYLDILREIGDKYKKKQWGWIWSEATAQLKLEESLEIGGFGYPAMAVVNFKKMKFSVLKGSFSKDGINEFLRSISYGRGETLPIRGATKPNINEVQGWDGKDGELPIEEEIDLSDVVMDETVKTEL